MVGITPIRNGPLIGARAASTASVTAVSAVSAMRARSTSSSPSGVNTTCLPAERSRIGASSWLSSVSMPAESVDWVTVHAKAARPKCRVSASATR
jgi:hypothetical protein